MEAWRVVVQWSQIRITVMSDRLQKNVCLCNVRKKISVKKFSLNSLRINVMKGRKSSVVSQRMPTLSLKKLRYPTTMKILPTCMYLSNLHLFDILAIISPTF